MEKWLYTLPDITLKHIHLAASPYKIPLIPDLQYEYTVSDMSEDYSTRHNYPHTEPHNPTLRLSVAPILLSFA